MTSVWPRSILVNASRKPAQASRLCLHSCRLTHHPCTDDAFDSPQAAQHAVHDTSKHRDHRPAGATFGRGGDRDVECTAKPPIRSPSSIRPIRGGAGQADCRRAADLVDGSDAAVGRPVSRFSLDFDTSEPYMSPVAMRRGRSAAETNDNRPPDGSRAPQAGTIWDNVYLCARLDPRLPNTAQQAKTTNVHIRPPEFPVVVPPASRSSWYGDHTNSVVEQEVSTCVEGARTAPRTAVTPSSATPSLLDPRTGCGRPQDRPSCSE